MLFQGYLPFKKVEPNGSSATPSTVQYSTIQYSTVEYSRVQCSAVQCSTVPDTVQCSTCCWLCWTAEQMLNWCCF